MKWWVLDGESLTSKDVSYIEWPHAVKPARFVLDQRAEGVATAPSK